MSTKTKPLSPRGTKPPETRLTYAELLNLVNVVHVDLRLLERVAEQNAGVLDKTLQEHKDLITKLEQMRTEAWRRENPTLIKQ